MERQNSIEEAFKLAFERNNEVFACFLIEKLMSVGADIMIENEPDSLSREINEDDSSPGLITSQILTTSLFAKDAKDKIFDAVHEKTENIDLAIKLSESCNSIFEALQRIEESRGKI